MSGGMALTPGGPTGMTAAQHIKPPPSGASTGYGMPPLPPSGVSALGADQLDKNQKRLTLRTIRNVAEMPIVSLDLYGDDGQVAYFPSMLKKEDDNEEEEVEDPSPIKVKSLGVVGLSKTSLVFKGESDVSHRAVRRLIAKGEGYNAVFRDALTQESDSRKSTVTIETRNGGAKDNHSSNGETDKKSVTIVKLPKPHLLLGARNTKYLHKDTVNLYNVAEDPSNVAIDIDTASSKLETVGACIRNSTLDGSSSPNNDDDDRVSIQLKLRSDKKALSILPEEAVAILLGKAKHMVSTQPQILNRESDEAKDESNKQILESTYMEYPTSIALPTWACHDSTIEALYDADSNSATTLYQRPIAALAGAMVGKMQRTTKQNEFTLNPSKIAKTILTKFDEHEKTRKKKTNKPATPLVIMAGLTSDGIELSAIKLGKPFMEDDLHTYAHCPILQYDVVANVAYRHSNPLSIASKAIVELTDAIDTTYPELEEDGGIAAIITYGSIPHQLKMKDALVKTLKTNIQDDPVWNNPKLQYQSTREDIVASGTAVLAASTHGRITCENEITNSDGEKEAKKTGCALTVRNLCPVAVGIQLHLQGGGGGDDDHDDDSEEILTPIKTLFDFDRRVPAIHSMEFTAAECVAIAKDTSLWTDVDKQDELLTEANKFYSSKHNALRDEAAKNLRVQILQRLERDGDWIPVGDAIEPLTIEHSQKEDTEKEGEKLKIGIENAIMEISVDSVGVITNSLKSDGKSIDEALKDSKVNTFLSYAKWIFFIGILGYFFVRSFMEDYIAKRDAEKLLAYYKHVVPNTISDGDERNARYLIWKYKKSKEKLWKTLENKYGVPVREAHEWPEEDEAESDANEEEEEDLDDTKAEEGNIGDDEESEL